MLVCTLYIYYTPVSVVNPLLWQFGRGKPCLGGLSGEETAVRKAASLLCKRGSCETSAELRLAGVARRIGLDWKYMPACTMYMYGM